jgi:uncharacterized protein YbjT (DUF2867 family)
VIFLTGGTGYVGRALIEALLARGHAVRALVRRGSERKLPAAAEAVIGDALDATEWSARVTGCDTFVHLVGTPHPNPSKAAEFERVDLASVRAAVAAARAAAVRHFIYVSVAQPAPVMHAYIAVRARGEAMIREAGLPATILRPWYVLGPGHWWPVVLLPLYAVLRLIPATRGGAARLGLVTHRQMIAALVRAVESPAEGIGIVEVPEIRAAMPGRAKAGVS